MNHAIPASSGRPAAWWAPILAGCRGVSWLTLLLVFAINFGVALILYIDETRAFWHPLVTAQCFGLSIAYAVNAAKPWQKAHPLWWLALAVAIGTGLGVVLLIAIKGYVIGAEGYALGSQPTQYTHWHTFAMTASSAYFTGLCVSVFFLLKFSEARARTQMLKADAERVTLSKQALEAELKLMQAQVEPHFLFNTLASVQFLTETDPPKANMMLGHLLAYLRAALPQLRSNSTTLGQEIELAQAYLSIMQMRMGSRLAFTIDVAADIGQSSFPPMLLLSLVENAIKHGLEPLAEGGTIRLEARRRGKLLVVSVLDNGRGLGEEIGNGVGLTNLRGRLRGLYADSARFTLEDVAPHGARAIIEIPVDAEQR